MAVGAGQVVHLRGVQLPEKGKVQNLGERLVIGVLRQDAARQQFGLQRGAVPVGAHQHGGNQRFRQAEPTEQPGFRHQAGRDMRLLARADGAGRQDADCCGESDVIGIFCQ
ncbi:hypothetical protein [Shinella sp.]|uniref:hypothetical protein n=1 Tax=Shinella sp. TaxID=1870904 RepID=UPI0028AB136A|nr:hypothetical protein [Shinella sp.]